MSEPLTTEQFEILYAYRAHWQEVGLSTKRADRPRAESAIGTLYQQTGRSGPRFVWCESPYACGPAQRDMEHAALGRTLNPLFEEELALHSLQAFADNIIIDAVDFMDDEPASSYIVRQGLQSNSGMDGESTVCVAESYHVTWLKFRPMSSIRSCCLPRRTRKSEERLYEGSELSGCVKSWEPRP